MKLGEVYCKERYTRSKFTKSAAAETLDDDVDINSVSQATWRSVTISDKAVKRCKKWSSIDGGLTKDVKNC
jgi:hypothetical protein